MEWDENVLTQMCKYLFQDVVLERHDIVLDHLKWPNMLGRGQVPYLS